MFVHSLAFPFELVIGDEQIKVPPAQRLATQIKLLSESDVDSGNARRIALMLAARLDLPTGDALRQLNEFELALKAVADLGLISTASARHVSSQNGSITCRATVIYPAAGRSLTVDASRQSWAIWSAALVLLDDAERHGGNGIAGSPIPPAPVDPAPVTPAVAVAQEAAS